MRDAETMKFSVYKPRPIRFLEVKQVGEWKVKIHTISINSEFPSQRLIAAATANLSDWLAESKFTHYRIAILIVHEGREGNFVSLGWWVDECMLRLYVRFSPADAPERFESFEQNTVVGCIWELAVVCHERTAWTKHILQKPDSPDFQAYLDETLNALV